MSDKKSAQDAPCNDSHLDYGIVSNGQVAALVGPRGEIDWLCMPALDSPSVFAALLDRDNGGQLAVETLAGEARWTQRYDDSTNVLISRCEDDDGAFEIIDAAVYTDDGPVAELVRLFRPLSGAPRLRVVFDPRLDYGKFSPTIAMGAGCLRAAELTLAANRCIEHIALGRDITLETPLALVLSWERPVTEPTPEAVTAAIDSAVARDREFVAGLRHRGDPRLIRSALVIRAHTTPSGAICAASTTSVPEAIGSPRTWDYRYAWVRDGCFAAHALLELGELTCAARLLDFFAGVCADGKPQPLYGIDGRAALPESELGHLAGFASTKPVRIGNAAAEQIQHDSMGQLIWLAAALQEKDGSPLAAERLEWLGRLADEAARVADTPDAGIWEFRHRPRLYTYSQLWIWVALDRAASLFAATDAERAAAFAERALAVRSRILEAAARVGFFAQTLEGNEVDASSLQIASLGLVDASDPLFIETINRVEATLEVGGLLARYAIEDDFGDTTSAFSLCQLWRIAALRQIGQSARADELFARFCSLANPVGLYAEDIEPTSLRQLGNFPQVYTHIGLIWAIG